MDNETNISFEIKVLREWDELQLTITDIINNQCEECESDNNQLNTDEKEHIRRVLTSILWPKLYKSLIINDICESVKTHISYYRKSFTRYPLSIFLYTKLYANEQEKVSNENNLDSEQNVPRHAYPPTMGYKEWIPYPQHNNLKTNCWYEMKEMAEWN